MAIDERDGAGRVASKGKRYRVYCRLTKEERAVIHMMAWRRDISMSHLMIWATLAAAQPGEVEETMERYDAGLLKLLPRRRPWRERKRRKRRAVKD